jgi:hypothetical protein
MKADKGRRFGTGSRADVQAINKPKTEHGKSAILARGGNVKESKAMMKKEIGFMKKAGAPKSMIKHEEKEYGMKKGGKKMATGGVTNAPTPAKPGVTNKPTPANPGYLSPPGGEGYAELNRPAKPGGFSTGVTNKLPPGNRPGNRPGSYGPTPRPDARPKPTMKDGGKVKKMASGGITTAKMGSVRTAAPSRDGVASKGKTKGTMVKMAASKPVGMKYGGKC